MLATSKNGRCNRLTTSLLLCITLSAGTIHSTSTLHELRVDGYDASENEALMEDHSSPSGCPDPGDDTTSHGVSQELDEISEAWKLIMSQVAKLSSISARKSPGLKYSEPIQVPDAPDEHDARSESGDALVNHRMWSSKDSSRAEVRGGLELDSVERAKDANRNAWKGWVSYHPSGQQLIMNRRTEQQKSVSKWTESGQSLGNKARYAIPAPIQATKTETMDEMGQQFQYQAPVMVNHLDQQQMSEPQDSSGQLDQVQAQLLPAKRAEGTSDAPSQRVRDSLRNAADIARQVLSRQSAGGSNRSESSATPSPSSRSEAGQSDSFGEDVTRSVWAAADRADDAAVELRGSQRAARFLGYGQLQRTEPIGASGRTQVRLSCQFGDDSTSGPSVNMTISDVEWARFAGPYDLSSGRDAPPFQCQESACSLQPVKTDTLTTIHPRPASQSYASARAPSYSLTLHEVQEQHLGVYRCSALRKLSSDSDASGQLVYRIIALGSI